MTTEAHPDNDHRTVDELINAALSNTDEEVAWNAVCALHWRGSDEVLQRARELCVSPCSQERKRGADILGQLGVPERTFPVECAQQLRSMLKKSEEADVLCAALVGLSHQDDMESIPQVASFATHPDSEVRYAVVLALTGHETPLAIESLISLRNDSDANVRDWSTFGLGTQLDLDTPAIRDALADRLDDPDDDTRGEALMGLARRKDKRVINALKQELASENVGTMAIEAAELIASKDLYSCLVALQEWWDIDPELLEQAISVSQS